MNLTNREALLQYGQDRFNSDFRAALVKTVDSNFFSMSDAEAIVRRAIFYFGQFTVCNRCSGAGKLDCFNYINRGVCYKCSGAGGTHAHSFDDTYKILVNVTNERFLKRALALAKAFVKSQDVKAAKQAALNNALLAKQQAALAAVSEEDAKSFSEYVELYFEKQYANAAASTNPANKNVFSSFHIQIIENFKFNGWGSPKQIAAVVKSLTAQFKKAESIEEGQRFVQGETRRFAGRVNSMTRETVQVNSWITNIVTKIVLKGDMGEIVIIKTGNDKLIDQFQKYKDDGVKASIKGSVSWVNPALDVNMAVFTAKGMKIDKYF